MRPASLRRWLCGLTWVALGCGGGPESADAAADADVADAGDGAGGAATDADAPLVEQVALGVVVTGADGYGGPIAFDLPADVTALTLVLQGPGGVELQVAGLERDSPVALVPPAWLGISTDPGVCLGPCANRVLAQPERAAFLFPNTSLVALLPGPHRLRVYAFRREGTAPTPAAVEVIVRASFVRPPLTSRRRLPLNLALTGAGGIDAALGPDHPALQAALAEANVRLMAAGVELAPVRYRDVASSGAFVLTRHGDDSDLAALFRSGADLEPGVNAFLVETIYADGGGGGGPPGLDVLLGIAGGVPGEPDAAGTSRAGVAVAADFDDPVRLGRTLAHEICHYLGLFHTSEAPGADGSALADPLPDTPSPAGDNLMHWSVGTATQALSHEQAQVLRRSPMLRAGDER